MREKRLLRMLSFFIVFIIICTGKMNNIYAGEMTDDGNVDISIETDKNTYSQEDINAKVIIKNMGNNDVKIKSVTYTQFIGYEANEVNDTSADTIKAGSEKTIYLNYVYDGSSVSPQTGDYNHVAIYILLLLFSIIFVSIYLILNKKARKRIVSLLMIMLILISSLMGVAVQNINAGTVSDKSISISKELMVNDKAENLEVVVDYCTIDNEDYMTRGQLVHNLLDYYDVNKIEIDSNVYEYHFLDTCDTLYGIDAESAWNYGLLPDDGVLFRENEYVSREYAAYIIYHLMGFEGDYSLDYADSDRVTYNNEVSLIATQQFIPLINGKFLPDVYITTNDYNIITDKIDEFNNAAYNCTDEAGVLYKSGVVEIQTDKYSYDEKNDNVYIEKNEQTSSLKAGDIFVLPAKDDMSYVVAGKVISCEDYNGGIKIICSEPDYDEVIQDINISKNIQLDMDTMVLEDGVSVEYDTQEENDISLLKIATPDKSGKVKFKIGKEHVYASLEVDIPTYTINWGLDQASLVMNYKGKLGGNIEYKSKLDESSGEKYENIYKLGEVFSVPVKGLFKLEVDLYLYVSISGKVSVVWDFSGASGVQYKNGTFRIIKDYRFTNLQQPSVQMEAATKLGPSIVGKFISKIGNVNLIQIDVNVGGAMKSKADYHNDINPVLKCVDYSLYAYLELGLDKECQLAKLLKFGKDALNFKFDLKWIIYDQNNSPLKWKMHVENDKIVPACTYGYGIILGKVVDNLNNPIHNATINVVDINSGEIVASGISMAESSDQIGQGEFLIKNIRIGNYKINISAEGFETKTIDATVFKDKRTDCGTIQLSSIIHNDYSYSVTRISDNYDIVKMISDNNYLVVKNGLCGIIDASGNIKIPVQYDADKSAEVATDEILLVKNNIGYVYNNKTLNLLYNYIIEETSVDNSEYNYEDIEEASSYRITPENTIKREYWQGMIIETVDCGVVVSYGNSSGTWNTTHVKFINAATGKVIIQGYGKDYMSITYNDWNGVMTGTRKTDKSAIAIINDVENDKLYMCVVTKYGYSKVEISAENIAGGNVSYDNHWIKMLGFDSENKYVWKLINSDTGYTYFMPYQSFSRWYYGNGEYYALSLNGITYDICYRDKIISNKKYTFVNFTNDNTLIAGDIYGNCIFMDYNLNEKLRVKDSSIFDSGKALVYDGIGLYYIDESCNRMSGYIYETSNIDTISTGAFKVAGQWYLINKTA